MVLCQNCHEDVLANQINIQCNTCNIIGDARCMASHYRKRYCEICYKIKICEARIKKLENKLELEERRLTELEKAQKLNL